MNRRAARGGVVFVNYHSEHLIAPRARRFAEAGVPVVVADNSATFDGSLVSGASGGSVTTVDTGGNRGFGAACNRAVAELPADVEVVCLHNPDVDAPVAALDALLACVTGASGAVAPAIATHGAIRTRGFHYPSPGREAYLAWRARRAIGSSAFREPAGAPPMAVPAGLPSRGGRGRRFGSAAFLVVSRAAFVAVGGFDERYFLYAEDLDLWHRLGRAGFVNRFAPHVLVAHGGATGSPLGAGSRELYRQLGVECFAELHDGHRWRKYRRVHRRQLGDLRAAPELVELVVRAWDADRRPTEVIAAVRPSCAMA
jgi:N-acetylglucosaminyl-diphospho-decaprenol L-rhamnosyltransferase